MFNIPPLAAGAFGSTQAQRAAEERAQQLKRAQDLARDSAGGDRYEHAVESSEEIVPIHDEQPSHEQKKRNKGARHPHADDESASDEHLDIKA